jgi:hypothetical protein
MIHFHFNIEKATQAAAIFLMHAGGSLTSIELNLRLYLADREAIKQHCSPICGGHYVSTEWGPMILEVMLLTEMISIQEFEQHLQLLHDPIDIRHSNSSPQTAGDDADQSQDV